MKKKENEITIKTIWKWLRSEKGKRYTFLIFYLFFFIFLFIFMNINYKSDNKEENTSKEYSLPFSTNIFENDYNFQYITKCESKETYLGSKKDKIFTYKNNQQLVKLELINGELSTNSNNIEYVNFTNIYFLKSIIKNSKLISETKLNETEEYLYNYKIKNNVLANYLKEDKKNELESNIIVKTNKDKQIKEIKLDLSNYKNELTGCTFLYEVIINE